jgi:hypothetical protein
MARIAHSDQSASLFPYLSVLLCIIGVLFLGVVVVSTGQLQLKKSITQNQGMWEEYQALLRQRQRAAEAARSLQALRDEKQAALVDLTRLRHEIENLEALSVDAKRRGEQLSQTQEQIAKLEVSVGEKRKQAAELAKTREERLLAAKAAPKPGTVRIVGTARMSDVDQGRPEAPPKPLFLECKGSNVILRPEGAVVPSSELEKSSLFQERVARAERDRDRGVILVLLIRSDGVKTFDRANKILSGRNLRYGYLPIPGSGDIDLGAFN